MYNEIAILRAGQVTMNKPIRVVIVDDHPLIRAGLLNVLQSSADICVVAEGVNGEDALRLVDQHHPDVLVLDVNLPIINGVEVTRRLHRQNISAAILILTFHDDKETVFGLLEAGANGFVLKVDALETIASAIRVVAEGESWLSPKVASYLVHRITGQEARAAPVPLTIREIDVLRLLAHGLDNDAIAGQLALTKRTVQNHVSAIYGKLGVTTRAEAVLYAIKTDLVQVPSKGNT
jgi:DNA-binding NarL/FixJ family response regulator